VAAIIKQVQSVLSDPKSQELVTLLQKERALEAPTTQQLINYRREAENIVGVDENVYRICWLTPTSVMQIQLLGKNDISTDDATTLTERWRQYIESYVLPHQTEGLTMDVKPPLLRRSLDSELDGPLPPSAYHSRARLQIKVCIRTYRLFFVAGTEDFYWRKRSTAEIEESHALAAERRAERKAAFAAWLNSKIMPTSSEGRVNTEDPMAAKNSDVKNEDAEEIDAPRLGTFGTTTATA